MKTPRMLAAAAFASVMLLPVKSHALLMGGGFKASSPAGGAATTTDSSSNKFITDALPHSDPADDPMGGPCGDMPVPEPAGVFLTLSGLASLAGYKKLKA